MSLAIVDRQRRVSLPIRRLARTGERVLAALGRAGGHVDVLVVDDVEVRRLNRAFRGVGRRTDVLAFPVEMPRAAGGLIGQIVISSETAARQARRLTVPIAAELDLLLTHGLLHLVGYDDRDPVEAAMMHERERELLGAGPRRPPDSLWEGLLHR